MGPFQGRCRLLERPFNDCASLYLVALEEGQPSPLRKDVDRPIAGALGQQLLRGPEAKGGLAHAPRALIDERDGCSQLGNAQTRLMVARDEPLEGLIGQEAAPVQRAGVMGRVGLFQKGVAFAHGVADGPIEAGGLGSPLLGPAVPADPLEGASLGVKDDGLEPLVFPAASPAPGPPGLVEAPDRFGTGGRLRHHHPQLPEGPGRLPKLARAAMSLDTRPEQLQSLFQMTFQIPAPP